MGAEATSAVAPVDLSDGELVHRHLAGDRQAFEDLYRRFQPRLVLYCRLRVVGEALAEDLAQEAFVRALESLDDFDIDRPLWPWLKTIASRLSIDHARKHGREVVSTEAVVHGAKPVDESHEERLDLECALSHLKPRQALALRLFYLEEWSASDLCHAFGLSRSGLDQLLYRARGRLKQECEKLGSRGVAGLVMLPVAVAAARIRGIAARVRTRVALQDAGLTQAALSIEGAGQVVAAALIALGSVASAAASVPEPQAAVTLPSAEADVASPDYGILAGPDALGDSAGVTDGGPTSITATGAAIAPAPTEKTIVVIPDGGHGALPGGIAGGRAPDGDGYLRIDVAVAAEGEGDSELRITVEARCSSSDATREGCDLYDETQPLRHDVLALRPAHRLDQLADPAPHSP